MIYFRTWCPRTVHACRVLIGALRSDVISDLGQQGFSAQYPGKTPTRPAPPGPGCQDRSTGKQYCLFDVVSDPFEEHDLFATEPAIGAALFGRYQALANEMAAPNSDDHNPARDHPLRCDTDLCWERGGLAAAAGPPACSAAGTWYLGSDVFNFAATGAGAGAFSLTIKTGCTDCAFTRGAGTTDGAAISVVASGKGEWIDEQGVFEEGCDRIRWVHHNVSGHGAWRDFCRGAPCDPPVPPGPPRPPSPPNAACAKMLETGYWAPWME